MNIQQVIKYYGAQNLRFLVPMRPVHNVFGIFGYTSSSDAEVLQICRITEDRYKLEENYKIQLKSEDKRFGKEAFYISDLNSLVKQGSIRVFHEIL